MRSTATAFVFSAILGMGVYTSGAMAAPISVPSLQLGQAAQGQSPLLEDVASRNNMENRRWNRRMHGDRCNLRRGDCRHYHNGYYYRTPWWLGPSIIGGVIIGNEINRNRRSTSAHVAWCVDQYRSYNPRTNTWLSNSGEYRQCNSPY